MALARRNGKGKVIAWEKNPLILQRIDVGIRAFAEAKAPHEQLRIINDWCDANNVPRISERTMRDDRSKALSILRDEIAGDMDERLAEYRLQYKHILRRMYEELETNHHDVARSTILGNIQRTISEMAKTQGDTITKVEQRVERTDSEEARALVIVLKERYGEEEAMRVLQDAQRKLVAPDAIEAEFRVKDEREERSAHSGAATQSP